MRVLDRKLARDLLKSRGQAIAIALVILSGTATYIAFASAHNNLLLTRDTYYVQYRFADFEISLERAPLTAAFKLETIPGVHNVVGRIVKDVNVDIDGVDAPRTGRVISMPDQQRPTLNDIVIMSGRYFSSGTANEVILSDAFARENGLEPGDRIQASIEDKKYTLRVVGTALSPEYIYMIRGTQEIFPSPESFGILWMPKSFTESAFGMQEACNNFVGDVDEVADIEKLLDTAEDILDPYGVFATVKRHDQISNRFLSDEIRGLEVSARITPAIFMGIAAMILLVLLNRMVTRERTQIGLLKAYGYSNFQVSFHYIKFALILGVVGALGGMVVGQWLAHAMVQIYVQFFQFPLLRSRAYPEVMALSLGISAGSAVLGAVMAARQAAHIRPAEAMRPPAPRHGHRTLLERSAFVWRRLSFTWKMIVRNVARYRRRAALTVFGVTIASGIVMIGYNSMDSMEYMLDFQFKQVQRYDAQVGLQTERGKPAWYDIVRFPYVRHAEPMLQYPFEMRSAWREKDALVIGLPRDGRLMALIDDKGRQVDVGDSGLVLTDRLARQLGVKAGDTVRLKPLMGRITKEKDVPVSKVVRQYLGSSAYMNLDALARLLDEPFALNAALLNVERGKERDLARAMKDILGVSSVEIKQDAYDNAQRTLAESMRISGVFLVLFSGIISFAIIYNTTLVSLAERRRELASLRVMGFTNSEVGRIMYNENFLLSTIGVTLGIPVGMFCCWLIIKAYDTEMYRLPFHIEHRTFVVTIALNVVFILLANLAVRRKIRRLDLVEVLKERE